MSWQIWKRMAIGYEAGYGHLEIESFGSEGFVKDRLGLILNLHHHIRLGATITDGIAYYTRRDILVPRFCWGIGIWPHQNIFSNYDMSYSKVVGWRQSIGFGLTLSDFAAFTIGCSDKPLSISLGLSVSLSTIELFGSAQWHETLGRSQHWGFSWRQ